MKHLHSKRLLLLGLAVLLLTLVIPAGCARQPKPTSTLIAGVDLAATMVPDIDLDAYLYVKQQTPTTVPGSLIRSNADIQVESLALWATAGEDSVSVAGSLVLTSAAEATRVNGLVAQNQVWTRLSDKTIYFVDNSARDAQKFKNAISNNKFKRFDDQNALEAISLMPGGGTTRLAGVAIVKPNQEVVKLITKNAASQAYGVVETAIKYAQLQSFVVGLYAPEQINVAQFAAAMQTGIGKSNLGVLVSLKSGLPGAIVGPLVKKYLNEGGYAEKKIGEIAVHPASFSDNGGNTIRGYIRVDGNRIYAAMSGQDAYAQTLITSVK